MQDPETSTHGTIRLEGQLDLEAGIHQELFDSFTDTIMSAAGRFWSWAHTERNL